MTDQNEPLVSVVIPTYQRPAYFREALRSVVQQTYKNLDIYITDNSHDEETKRVYEEEFADDPRITYDHHPEFDAQQNWARAIDYDNLDAPYVNWLMDDDLFFLDKIERMMACFREAPDIVLVTSERQVIDAAGRPMPYHIGTKLEFHGVTRLNGQDAGRWILLHEENFLGEPTTVLIKKAAMHEHRLGWTGHEGKYLISDFPTWLCALTQGDCVFFEEPLSAFRVHQGQQQMSTFSNTAGRISWAMAIREAIRRSVFLKTEEERRSVVLQWIEGTTDWLKGLPAEAWERKETKDLCAVMHGMVEILQGGMPMFDIDTGA